MKKVQHKVNNADLTVHWLSRTSARERTPRARATVLTHKKPLPLMGFWNQFAGFFSWKKYFLYKMFLLLSFPFVARVWTEYCASSFWCFQCLFLLYNLINLVRSAAAWVARKCEKHTELMRSELRKYWKSWRESSAKHKRKQKSFNSSVSTRRRYYLKRYFKGEKYRNKRKTTFGRILKPLGLWRIQAVFSLIFT